MENIDDIGEIVINEEEKQKVFISKKIVRELKNYNLKKDEVIKLYKEGTDLISIANSTDLTISKVDDILRLEVLS